MSYTIRTVTTPSTIPLPFTLADAKVHLRVDDAAEDTLITSQIRAAMRHVENTTGHILTPRVLEMAQHGFPDGRDVILLPREPVTGIVSVKYDDAAGAEVALTNTDYRWNVAAPNLILPTFGVDWPVTSHELPSVRIQFNAGYPAGEIEPDLVAATKLVLTHLYEDRGGLDTELPPSAEALCSLYRRIPA